MEGLWTSGVLASNTYINISLVFLLRSCHPRQTPPLTSTEGIESEDVEDQQDGDVSFSLSDVVSWLVGEGGEKGHHIGLETGDDCQDLIHSSVGGAMYTATVLKVVTGVLVVLGLSVLLFPSLWRKLCGHGKKEISSGGMMTKETKDNLEEQETEVSSVGSVGSEQTITAYAGSGAAGVKAKVPTVIPLAGGGRGTQSSEPYSFLSRPDSSLFLRHTVDHLSVQLDWLLGVTASSDQSSPVSQTLSATATSLLTPRLQRKGSIRRPRWRTLTSLPLESAELTPDDKSVVRMWQKVADMERRMAWSQEDLNDLDISAVQDSRLSTILQFYQQTCPVSVDQWNASCLIVNYVLTLLEQELASGIFNRSPLKVMELQSFGSAANKTCIGRANRFNVLLVLQLPFCSEMNVYDCEVCDDIPAGRLVLGVKEGGGGVSPFVQKDRIGDCFGSFLSVKEIMKASQKLFLNAMDRLKLKNKLLLDRLSFSIHVDQYNDLQICIDTRMVSALGLGLSEIRLRLTPALRVSSEEIYPLPSIYAVPPWNAKPIDSTDDVRSRIQSRIMRSHNSGIPGDLLWQLNCCELTKSFMSSTEGKMMSAGVSGCQVICQQILHAVFSCSGKDNLLTTGELHPSVLDSVIYFLLLESPSSSWNLHCLPDRFSDCVHFLRSAVQSSWMPGFMLHNPHLLKQMPALQMLPLLRSHRQENLLASLGSDDAENILSFMESRLQETGLRRCVKEDYSTEMWEYEFFIFG